MVEDEKHPNPKVFISYSWTNPDHEQWVLRLATDLRECQVDAILDKWDLKEGHDAHAFMEKMVTDPQIKKVVLVCDKVYAEKADGRSGGVGTEAQIISREIYAKQAQDKFVAVVTERDADGKACLPAYYSSRIYIDFTDPTIRAVSFEQLLRWAYDQPLHKKPGLGTKPQFLSNEAGVVALVTDSRLHRAVEALKSGRDYAIPAVNEYFHLLATELEKFRLDSNADPFDEAVFQSIASFVPYRNQVISLFMTLAAYKDGPESRTAIHRFFEEIIPYMNRPATVSRYRESDWDNFRFIIHELFLYAVASLIRYERFESAGYLLGNQYYLSALSESGRSDPLVSFNVFRSYAASLEHRNKRLGLGRLSLRADLLRERCVESGLEFRHLMQADFVLFIRSWLDSTPGYSAWLPETLVYSHPGPFEIFARSRSAAYFDRIKPLLSIDDKSRLDALVSNFATNPDSVPRWGFESFTPAYFLGAKELATRP